MSDDVVRTGRAFFHPRQVKPHELRFSYTWGLGGIAFGLTAVAAITGVLLMFGYRPAASIAYADAGALAAQGYGQFLRSLHRWSAYLLLIVAVLHLMRVFYHAAYKGSRKANWVIGVLLLGTAFFMAMTGNVLPWDTAAMSVTAVVSTMARAVPLVGGVLEAAMLGPSADATLLRAYVFHVALLPFVFFILLGVHLWKVRKDGLSGPGGEA